MLDTTVAPPISYELDKPDESVYPADVVSSDYPTVASPLMIVDPALKSVKVILSV